MRNPIRMSWATPTSDVKRRHLPSTLLTVKETNRSDCCRFSAIEFIKLKCLTNKRLPLTTILTKHSPNLRILAHKDAKNTAPVTLNCCLLWRPSYVKYRLCKKHLILHEILGFQRPVVNLNTNGLKTNLWKRLEQYDWKHIEIQWGCSGTTIWEEIKTAHREPLKNFPKRRKSKTSNPKKKMATIMMRGVWR